MSDNGGDRGFRRLGEIADGVVRDLAFDVAKFVDEAAVRGLMERAIKFERWRIETWLKHCESPIEAQLGAHLALTPIERRGEALFINQLPWTFADCDVLAWGDTPPGFRDEARRYCLYAQQRIDRYRVDFLAAYRPQGSAIRYAVVECDGHDFHSSKEQRERDNTRDRAFAERGVTVLRFTGTEIARDPARKAAQVVTVLENGAGAA